MRLNSTCSGADSGRRTRRYSLLFLIASAVAASAVSAADLRNVVSAEQEKLKLAQQSQERIDQLSDERKELYSQFKAVNKEIEGLKVYNKQLSKQIVNQRKEMERIRQTMEDVQVTQRQVVPQMLSMIEGLKQFVALLFEKVHIQRDELLEPLDHADLLGHDLTLCHLNILHSLADALHLLAWMDDAVAQMFFVKL
jgi:predicted RNase H-like nuclease (RuvC/YqgF family)